MRVLVLVRVLRVVLVVVVRSLLLVELRVGVALRLAADAHTARRLLGRRRVRRSTGTGRTGLEHRRIFDEGLRDVARAVRRTVILVLRVRVGVVIGDRGRVVLLGTLSSGGLRLVRSLRGMLLSSLGGGWGQRSRRRLLRSRQTLDIVVVASTESRWLVVLVVEALSYQKYHQILTI